jgi:hypothetical protein
MRQGLTEWAIVTAVLVLAATAGSLRFGGELRAACGVGRTPGAAAAPVLPLLVPAPRR